MQLEQRGVPESLLFFTDHNPEQLSCCIQLRNRFNNEDDAILEKILDEHCKQIGIFGK